MCRRPRAAAAVLHLSRSLAASASSAAVDSILLRSLKDHYLQASKATPPPKFNPPEPYEIIKGALDGVCGMPVLRREYSNDEEVLLSVARLVSIFPAGDEGGGDDSVNQLLLHAEVAKVGSGKALHFVCGLYPDAIGIHSVCLRPKGISSSGGAADLAKYQGRAFQELEPKVRDALHLYIEARGINEELFPFLQAWIRAKHHRRLMSWFKNVASFINEATKT